MTFWPTLQQSKNEVVYTKTKTKTKELFRHDQDQVSQSSNTCLLQNSSYKAQQKYRDGQYQIEVSTLHSKLHVKPRKKEHDLPKSQPHQKERHHQAQEI